MFFAFLKNTITFTGSNVLKFDEVTTNLGNNYNPSTGEFIAPRKGIYQFSCIILASGGNSVHYQLNRNNEVFTNGYTSKTSHANSSSHNWIIELKKGDRAFIRHRGSSSETVAGSRHTYFNGYLLQ